MRGLHRLGNVVVRPQGHALFAVLFAALGGDDDDGVPVYTVKALIPPLITEIAARCEFPAYTAMPSETLAEGDLEIPMGTTVELKFKTNMALRQALLTVEDRDPVPLLLSDDGRSITTSFIADRTFGYSLLLTGREGQKSLPDSAVFRIRAIQDRKPKARILYPTARPWYTTQAIVPVKLLVSDNYGVSKISLFYRKGPEGEDAERSFTAGELSAARGTEEIALASPELAGIHFTGSTDTFQGMWKKVGENIRQYHAYPRIVGETGGKNFIAS